MENSNTIERQITRSTLRVVSFSALGMAFMFALPHAHAQSGAPPQVPTNLQVPDDSQLFLVGRGVGTQNYVCLPSPSVGQVAWTLVTPQATLFSDDGDQLTTHFFSPNPFEASSNPFERGIVRATWQDSRDTSTVWARAIASSLDPKFVAPGAIPWVLLQVAGAQAGPTGGNTLSETTFIQRVNTTGGAAPSTGCDLPTAIGNKAFVPYTADYVFYKN